MNNQPTQSDELDKILDTLSEYDDVDRTLTIKDKLAYYPELKKAKQAINDYVTRARIEELNIERQELLEAYRFTAHNSGFGRQLNENLARNAKRINELQAQLGEKK